MDDPNSLPILLLHFFYYSLAVPCLVAYINLTHIYVSIFENGVKELNSRLTLKGDDIKFERKVSPFFLSPFVYLPFIAVLYLFFSFYMT